MRGPYADRPVPALNDRQRRNFWAKIIQTRDCWFWSGSTTGHQSHPYGRFRIGSSHYQAHRVAWTLHNGDIPVGRVLDHLCQTTLCVRPDHLRVVTQRVNVVSGDRWAS